MMVSMFFSGRAAGGNIGRCSEGGPSAQFLIGPLRGMPLPKTFRAFLEETSLGPDSIGHSNASMGRFAPISPAGIGRMKSGSRTGWGRAPTKNRGLGKPGFFWGGGPRGEKKKNPHPPKFSKNLFQRGWGAEGGKKKGARFFQGFGISPSQRVLYPVYWAEGGTRFPGFSRISVRGISGAGKKAGEKKGGGGLPLIFHKHGQGKTGGGKRHRPAR